MTESTDVLHGDSRTVLCACANECGDVPEDDDKERAVCKGLRGSGFEHDGVAAERNRYIRLFNRLEAAVSHHKKAHLPEGNHFADTPDEALWKARDKVLADACEGKG